MGVMESGLERVKTSGRMLTAADSSVANHTSRDCYDNIFEYSTLRVLEVCGRGI